MLADEKLIAGRSFLASSGNVCRFKRLESGVIRATWDRKASPEDIDECNEWAQKLIESAHGGPARVSYAAALSDEEEKLLVKSFKEACGPGKGE